MRVVSKSRLRGFWERHPAAEQPLRAWYREASVAHWRSIADVKARFPSADLVGERIVFNIGGNKYRLVTLVDFRRHGLLVRFVGTHAQYDRIDVRTV